MAQKYNIERNLKNRYLCKTNISSMSRTYPNDPKAWKTLESQYIFQKAPWLVLRQDKVQLPTGAIIDEFYVSEYPAWVNVVGITTDDEVVLIRQFRYAIGKVYFELPAGVVDKGETPLQAAQREMLEETGYGGGEWELLMQLCANPAIQTNITYSFLARGLRKQSTQSLEHTEEIAVHILSHQEVERILEEGEMIQSLHAAPLLKYLLHRCRHQTHHLR
ncbi:MAG: NUDIX hydrolase [Chloroherpetonaceae bacterium]|nr:NUDIX hydrolase [Chloroherpetonaceae bacterium]